RTPMHVCPTMDYVDRAWEDAKQGRPSTNPMLECTIPTAYDDSIGPPGKHIMCIFAQYAPYTLKDAAWDQAMKERFADRCIDALAEYAPTLGASGLIQIHVAATGPGFLATWRVR